MQLFLYTAAAIYSRDLCRHTRFLRRPQLDVKTKAVRRVRLWQWSRAKEYLIWVPNGCIVLYTPLSSLGFFPHEKCGHLSMRNSATIETSHLFLTLVLMWPYSADRSSSNRVSISIPNTLSSGRNTDCVSGPRSCWVNTTSSSGLMDISSSSLPSNSGMSRSPGPGICAQNIGKRQEADPPASSANEQLLLDVNFLSAVPQNDQRTDE